MKYTIELFEKRDILVFEEEDLQPGGDDPTRDPEDPTSGCGGVQHFLNEGVVTVVHECNSMYLDITVYNNDNVKIAAKIEIIDADTFKVYITPSIDGYVLWEKIK